jgi:hypothetical protein
MRVLEIETMKEVNVMPEPKRRFYNYDRCDHVKGG